MYFSLKRVLKIVFTGALVLAALVLLNLFIFRMHDENETRIRGFYMEPKDSIDVALIGASDLYFAYSPVTAYEEYGYTSYLYSISANSADLWIDELKQVERTQHPKLYVFDLDNAAHGCSADPDSTLRYLTDNMPPSKERAELINRYVDKNNEDGRLSYYIPFFKFHSDYPESFKDLEIRVMNSALRYKRGYTLLKGGALRTKTLRDDGLFDPKDITEKEEPTAQETKVLREFLEYCRSNNIRNVTFIRTPHAHSDTEEEGSADYTESLKVNNAMAEMIRAYGYDYVNFDGDYESYGLDLYSDFAEYAHVNAKGCAVFTKALGELLADTYHVKGDHSARVTNEWESCRDFNDRFMRFGIEKCTENAEAKDDKSGDSTDLWLWETWKWIPEISGR